MPSNSPRTCFLVFIIVFAIFTLVPARYYLPESWYLQSSVWQNTQNFNGTEAYEYLEAQCDFGPRPPGSDNLTACGDYIISVLEAQGWPVQTQTWVFRETPLRNIIAGAYTNPRLVLLAHYDTRPYADYEPDPVNRSRHILGANDGGSGTAALMELASVLPEAAKAVVTLLFVDAEDSGGLNGWPWIVGSTYFVAHLTQQQKTNIEVAILLDMMADASLQIKKEAHSTSTLIDVIWQIALTLNYSSFFLNQTGYAIIDDHIPFLQAGIPAIDLIDFDYPYWHRLSDTPDKCSAESLETVGRVVEEFVLQQLANPTTFRNGTTDFLGFWIGIIVSGVVIGGLVSLALYWFVRHKREKAISGDKMA